MIAAASPTFHQRIPAARNTAAPTTATMTAVPRFGSFTISTTGTATAKAGGTIEMIRTGAHDAAEMFKAAEAQNKLITWLVRLSGFLLMFIGLALVFRPLSVVADILPFVGSLIGFGTGLLAFFGALIASMLTVSVAWFFYRPLLSVALIAASVALVVIAKSRSKARAQT